MLGEYTSDDKKEEIRGRICEIMNFDENKKTYTIERGKKIMDNRKKLAEEKGMSQYELLGSKRRYEKKKST